MEKYIEVLAGTELFRNIAEADILRIIKSCGRLKKYRAGEAAALPGEGRGKIGIVLEGRVHIVSEDHYGNRNIIADPGEGEMFGEAFACSGKTLPVGIFADGPAVILWAEWKRLSEADAHISANMLNILAEKNITLNRKIGILSNRTIRDKLLAYLSAEAKGKQGFTVSFDRQGMADYISADRSAVSAELGKMRREGLIDFNKNRFRFLR